MNVRRYRVGGAECHWPNVADKEHASDVKTGHHWWSGAALLKSCKHSGRRGKAGGRGGYPLGKFGCEETGRDLEELRG